MGNSIFAEYTVPEVPTASGGPGLSWKLFTGVKTKTNEPRTVWVFDKKQVEKLPKSDQERALDCVKRDFANLAKLRHPLLLQVSKPLQDAGSALVVETEPVIASLANVRKHYKNLDKVPPELQKMHLEELEIKLGIIQLCEAIVFLHTSAQLVHMNITPESIFLTSEGVWKLAGFSFSYLLAQSPQQITYPEADLVEIVPTRPSLDYVAPEYIFLNRCSTASDMFSLGLLIYELYTGKPLLQCRGNVKTYKVQMQQVYPLNLEKIPTTLRAPLEQLLVVDPAKRLSAQDFIKSEFFNDLTVRILHYIAHILEKDDRSKAEFFKGLLTALAQFEHKMLEKRILPALLAELRNPILVPFVLPCIFAVAETLHCNDKTIFQARIFPATLPLFGVKEPFQILLLLLQRIDLFVKALPEKLVNDHISNLLIHALDHNNVDVKLAALKVGPPLFGSFAYEKLKTGILPRLEGVMAIDNSAVRVLCLASFNKIIPFFSRSIVEDQILPMVVRAGTVDRSGAVLTAVTGVCDAISKKFGEDITATKLLPFLLPISVDRSLSKQQFEIYFGIISGMIERIAAARRKSLEEQQSLQSGEEKAKKMEDFERFQHFSQQLNAPEVAVAKRANTPELAAAPVVPAAPPVDAAKADSFAELVHKTERTRDKLPSQGSSLLDWDSTAPVSPIPAGASSTITSTALRIDPAPVGSSSVSPFSSPLPSHPAHTPGSSATNFVTPTVDPILSMFSAQLQSAPGFPDSSKPGSSDGSFGLLFPSGSNVPASSSSIFDSSTSASISTSVAGRSSSTVMPQASHSVQTPILPQLSGLFASSLEPTTSLSNKDDEDFFKELRGPNTSTAPASIGFPIAAPSASSSTNLFADSSTSQPMSQIEFEWNTTGFSVGAAQPSAKPTENVFPF